jgi:hypothetical protein
MHTWAIWYPNAAADGLLIAIRVEVSDESGRRIAFGDQLELKGDSGPMTRLTRDGATITREDRWPAQGDLGDLVILPGGEVGRLTAWWNAEDGSEWRWSVEFYNHR